MIQIPGKGKGKIGGVNPDVYKDILERAAKIVEQGRWEALPKLSAETPTSNGKTTAQPYNLATK